MLLRSFSDETFVGYGRESVRAVRAVGGAPMPVPSNALQRALDVMRSYRREMLGHVWLLDPAIRTLEVYRLENGRDSLLDTFDGDEAVRVEPFDAIALELRVLWAR